ncbi:MAG: 50S ribosomal protein L11 methyltransferase [Deltaproteobacteria bacterium]|nr:50S ribosomal protein L11 methyltransferase [Deltaproteobacteria bacterium]
MSEALWHAAKVILGEDADPEGEQADLLSALLYEVGMEGIEIRDQAHPPELVVSFPPHLAPADITVSVIEALEEAGMPYQSVMVEAVAPVDWANHWRQHFTPLCFGRLWVVPTWLEPPPHAEEVLVIDPSSAFGTGLHATTALCMERIDALSPVKRVLDVGTGTGILALAALKLGATSAVGTDNDPEALRVADENAEQNALQDRLTLTGADVSEIAETFPLVVANILSGPLVDMAPALARTVARGGRLVLSGILGTQADDVVAAYVAEGLLEPVVTPRDEWVRIDLRREG